MTDARDYKELSEPYRYSFAVIARVDGCIVHQEVISRDCGVDRQIAVKIKL